MSISWLITNIIASFLLPPFIFLLIGVAGLILLQRRHASGKALIGLAFAGIWLLSTPLLSNALLDSLKPIPIALSGKEADAIVILGGGRNRDSIEYGGDTLSRYSLERVRYGAWLAKRLHKPVLVTGGAPDGGSRTEAGVMRDALRDEYGITTNWIERNSKNTRENAQYSAEILEKAGIRRIYLITHAWHLARAIPEFEAVGFQVVPAGTGYSLKRESTPLDYLPSAGALHQSHLAMHEWIGLLWYRIRN